MMEWFTFFGLLWMFLGVYVPYMWLGLNLEYMTIFCMCYMCIHWKRWDWVRTWRIWSWVRNDIVQIEFKGNIDILKDTTNTYLYVFSPHGTHCVSATLISTMQETKHIRVACTSVLFWTPIINMFVGWGNAVPATKHVMQAQLQQKVSLIVYPGGFNEIPGADFLREPEYTLDEDEDESLYSYNRRNGFIELAKNTCTPIVPVWVDGEYDTFSTWFPFPHVSKFMYKLFGYPWPMFTSGLYGSVIPKRTKLNVWIGEPHETLPEHSTSDIKTTYLYELDLLKKRARKDAPREVEQPIGFFQRLTPWGLFNIGGALDE